MFSPCSGLVVSGYSKTHEHKQEHSYITNALEPYKRFKKMYYVDTTDEFKGINIKHIQAYLFLFQFSPSQDFDSELNLRRVRIFFYATTFDRITKDRAAKFVDKLSAVGGTMGLLTGFSIISAVEIVYFGIKIILKILRDRVNLMK